MYYGPGAGAKPTATSVVSDLITIAKKTFAWQRLAICSIRINIKTQLTSSEKCIWAVLFFSLDVPDTPGQFLQLTQLMTKAEVSFDQLVQQKSDGQRARIVAITHQISKAQMQQVVTAIQKYGSLSVIKCNEGYRR